MLVGQCIYWVHFFQSSSAKWHYNCFLKKTNKQKNTYGETRGGRFLVIVKWKCRLIFSPTKSIKLNKIVKNATISVFWKLTKAKANDKLKSVSLGKTARTLSENSETVQLSCLKLHPSTPWLQLAYSVLEYDQGGASHKNQQPWLVDMIWSR